MEFIFSFAYDFISCFFSTRFSIVHLVCMVSYVLLIGKYLFLVSIGT